MIFLEDDFSVIGYRRLKAESRAYCPTGEGNGVDNSCSSSGSATLAPPLDTSWKSAGEDSVRTWDKEALAEKSPIKNGDVLESFKIKRAGTLREAQKNVPLTLDEIVTLGGGAVRGASIVVRANDKEDIEVSHVSPIDPDRPDDGSIESSIDIVYDPDSSQTTLHFGTLFPVETSRVDGELRIDGDKENLTDRQKTRVASVMMERVVESLSLADDAGFSSAEMLAVGSSGDSDKGYRLWPQFGFDGHIRTKLHERVSEWARKAVAGKGDNPPAWAATLLDSVDKADSEGRTIRVQELIATREGERWWDEHGETIGLRLDLEDKSGDGYKRFEKMRAKLSRLKKRNEGRSIEDWMLDLVDFRSTCERQPGGLFAPGNDCAAGSGSPAPRSDDYLTSVDDDNKSFTPGELSDSPPVTGGNVLRAFEVENVATVANHFSSGSGVSDMDKLMKIAGGVRRGGEVDVSGHTDSVRVHNDMPISPRGDKSQGTVSTSIAIASDDDGEYVYYADLSLVPPTTGDWTIGAFPPGYDKKVASIVMERMAESLVTAEECGLSYASTYAAGNKNATLKGYRLWPQFGFDGPVPDFLKPKVPVQLVPQGSSLGTLTIQQLISTRDGERWWDENGAGTEMTLSFSDKESPGYKRYSAAKARLSSLKRRNEGRAFCPTGEGGGVDNSCGGDGTASPNRESFPKSFPPGSEKFIDAVDAVSPDPDSVWDRSRGRAETPSPIVLTEAADEQESATGGLTPEAEKSYSSLVDEIGRQYESLVAAGLRARAWRGQGEPYGDPPGSTKPNSDKMREEVAKTGEFSFFMTEKGFGTGSATPDHPMLRETKYKTADGEPMIANDLFRVVHDMVAHVRGGYSFSTNGEFNGMLTHASTLPESAWPALFAETFGQNAVYEKTGNYAQQNAYASRVGPGIIRAELAKRNRKSKRAEEKDGDEPLGYQHLKVRPWLLRDVTEERGDAKAPPKDRIKGSDVNDEGSAKNQSGGITLDEATISALKKKAEEHNASMRKRGRPEWTHVRLPALKSVYRRGAGAFSTSHRPGMTRDRWAMARVNAFLYLARRGRPENSKYVGDNDLLNSEHPRHSEQSRSADCGRDEGGRFGDGNKCQIGININDSKQDFTGQILAGEKTIETRPTDSLRPYVGKTVGIVRTGKGKATLVGTMKVGEPKFYKSKEEFDADSDKHRVTKGSPYYIGKGGKYGYPLTEVTKVKPKELDSKGIIARVIGRSYGHDEIEYAFDEESRAFCATGDGGGVKNDCSSAEPGSAVAEVKAAKQRNVDVMIGGGKRVAVMDSEARDRAIADFKQHPKPEGSAAGSTTDLWDREFVTRPEGSNKISESDPVFPKETLRQNGQYVAHEAVGQYLSMRHEEERAAAGGTGPGNIIDLSNPDVDERQVDYVADALAEDAMHAYEVLQVDPGFYSTDLEKTMATMESRHPELASDENSKFIFTSLLAITSSGQGPDANLADADGLYRMWKEHGTVVPSSYGGGSRDVTTSLRNLQSLVDSFGVERTRNLLSGYAPASRVAKTFKTLAEKSGDPDWRDRTGSSELNLPKPLQATGELKDEVVPLFSVFGPKIGSFHANLSGRHDFLTMDRWLMRSVGRVTGDLVTRSTPEQAKARAKAALDAIESTKWKKAYLFGTDESHGITKEALVRSFKIQQQTGVIEENGAAFAWATAAERSHQKTKRPSGGGYGKHEDDTVHSLHQAGNSLFKSLIHEQQDPRTGTARSNIRNVFRKMQDKIEQKTGRRPDVDEIQAALWQYEKRLWKHLGAKTNIEDNSLFSSAADGLVSGRITQRKYSPASRRDLQQMEDADVAFDLHHFDAEQSAWTSDFVESGVDFVELMTLLEAAVEESRNFAALDYGSPVPADIERRAFCATGEGNGVDNSCSSSDGMFGGASGSNGNVTWSASSPDGDSSPPFRGAEDLASVAVSSPKQIEESLSEIKITPMEAVQVAGGRDGAEVFMRPAPEFSEEPPFGGSGVTPVFLDLQWDAAGLDNAVSGSAVIGASSRKNEDGSPEIVASLSTIVASDEAKADPAKRQTLAREFYRTMVASVESARKAGVSRIVFNAAGHSGKGSESSWKGYTIWPRMGFDAPIPQHIKIKLPEELSHAKSLLDLHATPEGTRWWAKNGEDIDVSLSLKDKSSPQNKIMEKFIKRFSTSRRDWLSENDQASFDELWQEIWDEGILDEYEWTDGDT